MQWRGAMPSRIQKEIESVAPLPTDAQEAREPTRKRNQYSRTAHSVIGEVHRMVEEALAVLDPKKRINEFTQPKKRGAFLLWHHERRAIEELTAPPPWTFEAHQSFLEASVEMWKHLPQEDKDRITEDAKRVMPNESRKRRDDSDHRRQVKPRLENTVAIL